MSRADCRIRVLIADDSKFARAVLRRILEKDPEICVVAEASDGEEAVALVRVYNPDVVIMDVLMPKKDGIAATREIVERNPVPILILSAVTKEGSQAALEALEAGALEVMAKPSISLIGVSSEFEEELRRKVRVLASIGRIKLARKISSTRLHPLSIIRRKERITMERPRGAVVIAASTGGPSAVLRVVQKVRAKFPVAMFIVQHMPPGFTRSFAERLNKASEFEIKEAEDGDEVVVGRGYVAPGDYHMLIEQRGNSIVIKLDRGPKIHGVRPAADPTLMCAAKIWGPKTVAAILTGMGCDGAAGALEIRKCGGYVIAQDEATSVVWGMPKAVIDVGAANVVLPLDKIGDEINRVLSRMFSGCDHG